MKELVKDILDFLIHSAFYSLIFPFVLFAITAIGMLFVDIGGRLYGLTPLWFISAAIFGICSHYLRGRYLVYRNKRQDKLSTVFSEQILHDEEERLRMKNHIKMVEDSAKRPDKDYEDYKAIEEHLKNSWAYRDWKNRKIEDSERKVDSMLDHERAIGVQ